VTNDDRFHWSSGSLILWSPAQTGLRMRQDRSRLRQSPRLSLDFDAVPYLAVAFHAAGLRHQRRWSVADWFTLSDQCGGVFR